MFVSFIVHLQLEQDILELYSRLAFNISLKQLLIKFRLPFIKVFLVIQDQEKTNIVILLTVLERNTFPFSFKFSITLILEPCAVSSKIMNKNWLQEQLLYSSFWGYL